MGPDATGVGWVYQYALKDVSGNNSIEDIRSYHDWFFKLQLGSVKGVSEIASFGGFEKQYQISVNPESMRAYGVSLSQISQAIKKGNRESGARVVEFSGAEYMIRAKGYVKDKKDIEHIVVSTGSNGIPIYVKNLARVSFGPEIRRVLET